jgi:hypothetical protein
LNGVQEAGGSNPLAPTKTLFAEAGPGESKPGLVSLQAGQSQEDTKGSTDESRTEQDTSITKPGLPENTILAQREHYISITGKGVPEDLAVVVESWDRLPDAIKAGILAMVQSAVKGKE